MLGVSNDFFEFGGDRKNVELVETGSFEVVELKLTKFDDLILSSFI